MSANCSVRISRVVSSPVGDWVFECCERGLHHLKLAPEVTNENFLQRGSKEVNVVEGGGKGEDDSCEKAADSVARWLRDYFAASSDKENVPSRIQPAEICPAVFRQEKSGSGDRQSFRQRAWEVLMKDVPFGSTVSYGELAKMCGSPGASRAMGSAMANNPISLLVPCHRVVTSGGAPGNYSKKTKNDVKVWLLRHEGTL